MNHIDPREAQNKYLGGRLNRLVRIYFYLQRGLTLVNEFKYLIAGIFAAYYLTGVDSYFWLVGMFIFSILVLILVGHVWVHYAMKPMEWFGVEFGTYFSRYTIDIQEKQIALLVEIKELLKNDRG